MQLRSFYRVRHPSNPPPFEWKKSEVIKVWRKSPIDEQKKAKWIVGLLLVAGFIGAVFLAHANVPKDEYRSFMSPDGRFKIVVHPYRVRFGLMPGRSGDAPGIVCLYETANGKLLERKPVEMVQLAEEVNWSPTNV